MRNEVKHAKKMIIKIYNLLRKPKTLEWIKFGNYRLFFGSDLDWFAINYEGQAETTEIQVYAGKDLLCSKYEHNHNETGDHTIIYPNAYATMLNIYKYIKNTKLLLELDKPRWKQCLR